jgi:hypothetical protein
VSSTKPKHRPLCALGVSALGERAPTLDRALLIVRQAKPAARRGFLDVGHELRESVVRARRFDDKDSICSVGYSSRLLGASPMSNPVDVVAAASGAIV